MPKPKRKQSRKIKNVGKPTSDARYFAPQPAREAHNDFERAGLAYRVVPVILSLLRAKVLTQDEYEKLNYYRQQASLADKSPVKSGIDFSVRSGSGNGPGVAITSAALETSRMERDMGRLWSLARAVAVDDMTLTEWCCHRHGTVTVKNEDGKNEVRPKDEERNMEIALLELRFASSRITVRDS